MKEIKAKDFTSRGWEEDPMFPPGFFYPKKNVMPHLHLTSVLDVNQKPVMAYLGYKDDKGNTKVIFKDEQWHENVVNDILEEKIKNEAEFAQQYSELIVTSM